MAERVTRQVVAEKAIIHAELPIAEPFPVDRSFELPTALYGAMAALYLGFVVVAAIGFAEREVLLPLAIIAVFIVMAFGVPAVWVRMAPGSRKAALSWSRFRIDGIGTAFGPLGSREAMVQVLILPALIFLWGIAVVTIAALA